MKNKRGAMKKEELAMVVSTTKQMGEKGKRAEFCEEEEKEEEQEKKKKKKKKKKNHVANEAAKCQKQQEDALLAGQKQVGRMKNKKLLCC